MVRPPLEFFRHCLPAKALEARLTFDCMGEELTGPAVMGYTDGFSFECGEPDGP